MSSAEILKKEIKKEFPAIDRDLQTYVEGEKVKEKKNKLTLEF